LLASSLIGGLLGTLFDTSPYSNNWFFGFFAGLFAFACLRLWLTTPSRDRKPEKYASSSTTRERQSSETTTLQAAKGGQQMAIALKRSWAFPVLLAIGATLYGIWSANYGPRYEENLKKLENEQKSRLPMKVDADTTWVDVKFEDKKGTYWYVVDFDALDQRVLQQITRDQACSNPEVLRTIKEKGFTYEYHYNSKKGAPLATVTIASCP
jgi:hypothetical protein